MKWSSLAVVVAAAAANCVCYYAFHLVHTADADAALQELTGASSTSTGSPTKTSIYLQAAVRCRGIIACECVPGHIVDALKQFAC